MPYIDMNTNLYDREKYTKTVTTLKTEEDFYRCLQILTSKNNHGLCQGIYGAEDIKRFLDMSEYVILRREKGSMNVVAFALMRRVRSKTVDVVLVCTVPNKERFGNMIAYDINEYAIKHKFVRIITEPRTPELRATFMKYGFEPLHGEILEKDVVTQTLRKTNKTLKNPRRTLIPPQTHKNVQDVKV